MYDENAAAVRKVDSNAIITTVAGILNDAGNAYANINGPALTTKLAMSFGHTGLAVKPSDGTCLLFSTGCSILCDNVCCSE